MIERVVVWFSAGVTSAVAAKIAIDKYRASYPVHLVMCDTGSEHDDNLRFANAVAKWLDTPLEIIKNEKYHDTIDVYRETGFIKNQHGARCTTELKNLPRRKYENLRTDLQVFGYDASEQKRAQRFSAHNPEVTAYFPLIEAGITKDMARHILLAHGIEEPITYSLGFQNANCLKRGCVKGQMGYWNHYRKVFPEGFSCMAKLERELGYAICSREQRGPNGERIKIPVFLDELPDTAGNYKNEPSFQCGLFCGEY